MKIVSVVGARPQFIKAMPLSRALRAAGHKEYLVHTGQHYDHAMSEIFFEELAIPAPDVNLHIGSGTHGWQTAQMLAGIEEVLLKQQPDWVLVFGDTNSTLAGALTASKLHIPIAHVEAGLRSHNRAMPEEINRIVTDHLSKLLFCPSQVAVNNLANEGIVSGVHIVGDVMVDALAFASTHAQSKSQILKQLGLRNRKYFLATVHRAENTDDPRHLCAIFSALASLDFPVVFPVHPRTKNRVGQAIDTLSDCKYKNNIYFVEPVSYINMVMLVQNASLVLTDSGGLQKEAYWLGVPCITLRDETEWIETVESGWNFLAGTDTKRILHAINTFAPSSERPPLYGDGTAAMRCISILEENHRKN